MVLAFFAALGAKALPYSPEVLQNAGVEYSCAEIAQPSQTDAVQGDQLLPFGNLDSWYIRKIKESHLMGGKVKTLYEVAPKGSTDKAEPYRNLGGSPWATSNVLAKPVGIVKTNTSVYREEREGHGYCAKLYTHLESCKVLGMVNIEVLAAGSLFLGELVEPVNSAKNPYGKMSFGMPFTKRPKAIKFDYKTKIVGTPNRIKKGVGGRSTVKGMDMADCVLYLQKRWEDAEGNIFASRVGTMVHRFKKSTSGWVNNASFTIHYGDITGESYYNASSMGLNKMRCAKNSKGKLVPVQEVKWEGDATPTHIVLQFSSSHGGAYIGTEGNTLWLDNIRLTY